MEGRRLYWHSGMLQQGQVVLERCYTAGGTQMEGSSTGGWGKEWRGVGQWSKAVAGAAEVGEEGDGYLVGAADKCRVN